MLINLTGKILIFKILNQLGADILCNELGD
jgi:hypothetical protein